MCNICDKLKNVPKNKKATVVLEDAKEQAFDVNKFDVIMQINHEDDGTPYAFIKQEVDIQSTERCYGIPIYITYCPFCGDKLI